MDLWKKSLISKNATVQEAIAVIDQKGPKIAVVVDSEGLLLGTVTDGDVRRAILKGKPIHTPVNEIMNSKSISAPSEIDRQGLLELMKKHSVHQIPILDKNKKVCGIEVLDNILTKPQHPHIVVLMAGGLGSRLRPLTDDIPKPLLTLGNKPILQIILENFIDQGFSRFYIAVNYKSEMIMEHFGDGSKFGVSIEYLKEEKSLGTAGALSLLPEIPEHPLIIMNSDLLTKLNFFQMLDFHQKNTADASMAVKEYCFQVPYGTVQIQNSEISSIQEKPAHYFFVNGGIYILNASVLALLQKDEHLDMPTLFQRLIEKKKKAAAFPVHEYWIDIGQLDDLERAKGDYGSVQS